MSGEYDQQPTNDNAVLSAQTEYVSDQIARVESRLKLRFKNQEYWSVSGTAPLERVREYGNIMHDLLGRIEVTADAQAALEALVSEGVIQTSEQGAVQELMNAFFTLPGVAEWFSGAYRVLREAEIITPKGMTYRPDRIMIDGKRVVIVDYKFGQHKDERYNRQVGNYMHLVREMGYEPEGYLCYVTLRSVERV